jgi:hypothetical protein
MHQAQATRRELAAARRQRRRLTCLVAASAAVAGISLGYLAGVVSVAVAVSGRDRQRGDSAANVAPR